MHDVRWTLKELIKVAEDTTAAPWRVRAHKELDEKDRTKVLETFYSINAGGFQGPFKNDGWFHPDNLYWVEDEITVIGCDYDEGGTVNGGLNAADANFIAAARNAIPALQRLLHESPYPNQVVIWKLLCDCIDEIRGGGEISTPKKIELFERAMRLGYDQNHNRSKSP